VTDEDQRALLAAALSVPEISDAELDSWRRLGEALSAPDLWADAELETGVRRAAAAFSRLPCPAPSPTAPPPWCRAGC
jgi:hypothetical protein